MQSIRLNIDGLENNETQYKVKNQLEGIIGISDISFSAGKNYVDINYDEPTTVSEINSHLQNNGYKVTDALTKRHSI